LSLPLDIHPIHAKERLHSPKENGLSCPLYLKDFKIKTNSLKNMFYYF
jgi:hypothetical protein